jgi:hypothetical protein
MEEEDSQDLPRLLDRPIDCITEQDISELNVDRLRELCMRLHREVKRRKIDDGGDGNAGNGNGGNGEEGDGDDGNSGDEDGGDDNGVYLI